MVVHTISTAVVVFVVSLWACPFGLGAPTVSSVIVRNLQALRNRAPDLAGIEANSPLDGTVMPANLSPQRFTWTDTNPDSTRWLLQFQSHDGHSILPAVVLEHAAWLPNADDWAVLSSAALARPVSMDVVGFAADAPDRLLSGLRLSFAASPDKFEGTLVVRQVCLPFAAVESRPETAHYTVVDVGSTKPPRTTLADMPTCISCHAFQGRRAGFHVRAETTRPSWVEGTIAPRTSLTTASAVAFRRALPPAGLPTFGLFTALSPDGHRLVFTSHDDYVFGPTSDLAFSMVLDPLRGRLAVHDRSTGSTRLLTGAADIDFVQTNPTFSPDGDTVVFARAAIADYRVPRDPLRCIAQARPLGMAERQAPLRRYDLYRMPFGDGLGGRAEPLVGASRNGMSNYFPRFSPDGRWIVFCRAPRGMALQPGSTLWIVPAGGGPARQLECNVGRMNSWHCWAPSGRWIVFVAKTKSPTSRLFAAHVDELGRSAPPLELTAFEVPGRSPNLPEFVAPAAGTIDEFGTDFVDALDYATAARRHVENGRLQEASRELSRAQAIEPDAPITRYMAASIAMLRSAEAVAATTTTTAGRLAELGIALGARGFHDRARTLFQQALGCGGPPGRCNLYLALSYEADGQLDDAVRHYIAAIEADPTLPEAYNNLGGLLMRSKLFEQANGHFLKALELDPNFVPARLNLATSLLETGRPAAAKRMLEKVLELDPNHVGARRRLAALALEAKDLVTARLHLSAILDGHPHDAAARLDLADIMLRQREFGAAADNYRTVADLAPHDSRAQASLGTALLATGRSADAVVHLEAAVELAPPQPHALALLSAAYAAVGRHERAAVTARKALPLARARNDARLVEQLETAIARYERRRPGDR